MRVLIIKMSSLGDVVHALPALTDAAFARPEVHFDWLVEHSFAAIPAWHRAVHRTVPVALRQWRAAPWRYVREWRDFQTDLRAESYDLVLDAQGLIKSALIALLARGSSAGFDQASVREPLASVCYQRRYRVARELHAVPRLRALFARALDYSVPEHDADYGLTRPEPPQNITMPYVVLLHGTTWQNKRWPMAAWRQLARQASNDGFEVRVPCLSDVERQRALAVIDGLPRAQLLDHVPLRDLGAWLAHASGVIGVDTGLAHLATAFDTPTVTLHGPTDAQRTGVHGANGRSMAGELSCAPCGNRTCVLARPAQTVGAAPCMMRIDPNDAWSMLRSRMRRLQPSVDGAVNKEAGL